MDHFVIESLLKNKFVIHKVAEEKYVVQQLGKKVEKYPVMIEVINDRFIMYRSRVSFFRSYMIKKFNIIQFVNNYNDLLTIDVDKEMKTRSHMYCDYTMSFVSKYSNKFELLWLPEYKVVRDSLLNLTDDFLTYIIDVVKDDNYLADKNIPNEFKAFIANSPSWMPNLPEMAFISKKRYLRVRVLRKFMSIQKDKGITYEHIR